MPTKISTVKDNQSNVLLKKNNTAIAKKDQKNVGAALSGKQYEPNRGQGSDRKPSVAHAHVTGPTMESTDMKESVEITGTWTRTGKPFKRKFSSPEEAAAYTKNNGIKVTDRRDSLGEVRMRNEARASEFRANMHLSDTSKSKRAAGHYLMKNGSPLHQEPHKTPEAALTHYKGLKDTNGVKIVHVKETWDNNPKASRRGDPSAPKGTWAHHLSTPAGKKLKKDVDALNKGPKTKVVKEDAPAMSAGAAGDPGKVQNATDNYACEKKKSLSMIRRKATK